MKKSLPRIYRTPSSARNISSSRKKGQRQIATNRPTAQEIKDEYLRTKAKDLNALMAEQVDAPDSSPGAERREGSTPSEGTQLELHMYRPGMIVELNWRTDYDFEYGEVVDPYSEGWNKPGSYFTEENDRWTLEDDGVFVPVFSYDRPSRSGGYTSADIKIVPPDKVPDDVASSRILLGDCPACEYYDVPDDDYICAYCRYGSEGLRPERPKPAIIDPF